MSIKPFSNHKSIFKILLTTFLVAFILIAFWGKSNKQVLLEFQEDSMLLGTPEEDGFQIHIAYEDISSIELLSSFTPGTCVSGRDLEDRKSGLWKNDLYGEYTLCVYAEIPSCITLTTKQGIVVFNYESDGTTRQLYTALVEHIEKETS